MLETTVSSGSSVIPIATEYFEYRAASAEYTIGSPVPHLVAIWDDWNNFELRTITSVDAISITVDSPFERDWLSGSYVVPCFYTLAVSEPRKVYRVTEDISSFQFTAEVMFSSIVPAMTAPELYNDVVVCPFTPSWIKPEESWNNKWTRIDQMTGLFEYNMQSINPVTERSVLFLINGRVNTDLFIRFIHTLSGKLNPFWLPANDYGFKLTIPANAGSSTITIEDLDYEHALFGSPAHSFIELVLIDGTIIRRHITNAITLPSGAERLTLDTPLPVDISPTTLIRCVWLEKVRLNSDDVTVKWCTDSCIEVTLPIVVLP
jgi:hypothetical protein